MHWPQLSLPLTSPEELGLCEMNPVTPGKPIVDAGSYLCHLPVKGLLTTERDRISVSSVSLDSETVQSVLCDSSVFPYIDSPVAFKRAAFENGTNSTLAIGVVSSGHGPFLLLWISWHSPNSITCLSSRDLERKTVGEEKIVLVLWLKPPYKLLHFLLLVYKFSSSIALTLGVFWHKRTQDDPLQTRSVNKAQTYQNNLF